MSERAADRVFVVNEEIGHQEIEGQLLLLLPDDYSLYTLNESGKLVWRELLRQRPLALIVARVAKTFAIPPAQAQQDVLALLGELEARQVIRRA